MTDISDKPADRSRQEILRVASRQFAQRPYHQVGLDDIFADAELTKGAMYFHFRSKYTLALAVIDEETNKYVAAVKVLVAGRLPALETLVDAFYLIAVDDITEDLARAALHLLESVGRIEGLRTKLLGRWIQWLARLVARAIIEGDIVEECDPQYVAGLLVALYMGMRQTSDLDNQERFLLDLEKMWALLLPGIMRPERIDYFHQFIRRRTALAANNISAPPVPG